MTIAEVAERDPQRRSLAWAVITTLGFIVVVAVLGFVMLQRQDDVQRLEEVVLDLNAVVIEVDRLNREQADQAFAECEQRNTRATETAETLEMLAEAHTADGNTAAAAVWTAYLEKARANPLPACERPEGPEPAEAPPGD